MNHHRKVLSFSSPFLLSALVATACGTGGGDFTTFTQAKGSALHQAESCEDLLWQIQTDAIAKLDDQVERYKQGGLDQVTRGGAVAISTTDDAVAENDSAPSAGADDGAAAPADPGNSGGEAQATEDTNAGANTFSETNTQVKDVDEADIIKVGDGGERLYVIHGNQLKIIDTLPADEAHELGETSVAGQPYELFVKDGKATVFSTVFPEGIPAKSDNGADENSKAISSECFDCCSYGGGQAFTQITVFDVSGDVPTVDREMIFEGDYVSSRRHGKNVRTVVRGGFAAHDLYYPDVNAYDSFGREKSEDRIEEDLGRWRDEVAADIENTNLDDWVPRSFEKFGGVWEPLEADCDSYFIPEPGLVAGGVTQVVTFDASDSAAPQVTSVLGGAAHVYANQSVMILAQTDFRWDQFAQGASSKTSLHEFRLDGLDSNYAASGFAPGYLENQFSIDERDGVIRLSTTEHVRTDPKNNPWMTEPKNTVITMEMSEGELVQMDRSDPMGEPGETIYSTRFMGDRAYIVTFRTTDPLFVVDVSDPKDLAVLGELHIPGFSEYIHPLGTDHLLTIGIDDTGDSGVALQIFDVGNPTDPKLVHKESYGGFSSSEANYNHKAFTYVSDYFAEGKDLLLFPLVTYSPTYRSGLEVLEVSRETGFKKLGTIDHAALINSDCVDFASTGVPCRYYGGEEMRRGAQINDYVYALSQGGVTVHEIAALGADATLATMDFAAPERQACVYQGGDDVINVEPGDIGDVVEPEVLPAMGGATGM